MYVRPVSSIICMYGAEKSQSEVLTESVVNQIMQSQTEIKEQLVDLRTLCSQVPSITNCCENIFLHTGMAIFLGSHSKRLRLLHSKCKYLH